MKIFNKKQKILVNHYIEKFLKKYNILTKITKTGTAGSADYYDEEEKKKHKIKIPNPIDPFRFGVGLHEIGHIVLGHCKKRENKLIDQRPIYNREFEAEIFAINHLKKIGFYTNRYGVQAIRYVMEVIAKEINEHHSINDVPKKIIRWTGLNLNIWKKARKIIVPREENADVASKNEIVIQYLMPRKKKFISKLNK